jgi:hypothetical protein
MRWQELQKAATYGSGANDSAQAAVEAGRSGQVAGVGLTCGPRWNLKFNFKESYGANLIPSKYYSPRL